MCARHSGSADRRRMVSGKRAANSGSACFRRIARYLELQLRVVLLFAAVPVVTMAVAAVGYSLVQAVEATWRAGGFARIWSVVLFLVLAAGAVTLYLLAVPFLP